jgi:hypothetical protein
MTEPEESGVPEKTEKQEELGNEERPAAPVSLANRLEAWGKVGLLAGGLCYGLGLVITNVYLAQYGISEFSAFRTEYVLTGASFLGNAVALGVAFLYCLLVIRRGWKYRLPILNTRFGKVMALSVILSAAVFGTHVLLSLYAHIIASSLPDAMIGLGGETWSYWTTPYQMLGILYGRDIIDLILWLGLAGAINSYRISEEGGLWWVNNRAWFYFCVLPGMLLMLGSLVIDYAQHSYGRVAPAYGGGYPESVQITLNKGTQGIAERLHLSTDSGTVIVSVKLLHESSDAYFLLPPDTTCEAKCIRLPKNLTRGVVYLKHGFAPDVSDEVEVTTDKCGRFCDGQ